MPATQALAYCFLRTNSMASMVSMKNNPSLIGALNKNAAGSSVENTAARSAWRLSISSSASS